MPTTERRTGDVVEQVAQEIRRQILDGELAPGMRLSQADVAEAMQVSRTPLREALHRLAAEGLVTAEANRGMRVAPIPLTQVEDAYALRLLAEPPLIRGMVRHLRPSDLEAMKTALHGMEAPHLTTREFQDAHFAFHKVMTERYPRAVQNLVMTQTRAIYRHQRLYFDRPRALGDFTAVDRDFLKALLIGDGELAGRIIAYHLIDAAIGVIHGAQPDYPLTQITMVADSLGIGLEPREDGRFAIFWHKGEDRGFEHQTSNLVLSPREASDRAATTTQTKGTTS